MVGVLVGNLLGGFVHAQTYLTAAEVPRGTILLMSTACPGGYVEVTALNGAMPLGTIAANNDVGTTGGTNTITPTVASLTAAAQTVNSLTAAAQGFTGDPTTVPALGAGTLADSTSGSTHKLFTSSASGVSAATLTGSTAAGTLTPLGHNANSAVTGTMNSSAVTGTLNSFDNRPAYVKVIFCQKS